MDANLCNGFALVLQSIVELRRRGALVFFKLRAKPPHSIHATNSFTCTGFSFPDEPINQGRRL